MSEWARAEIRTCNWVDTGQEEFLIITTEREGEDSFHQWKLLISSCYKREKQNECADDTDNESPITLVFDLRLHFNWGKIEFLSHWNTDSSACVQCCVCFQLSLVRKLIFPPVKRVRGPAKGAQKKNQQQIHLPTQWMIQAAQNEWSNSLLTKFFINSLPFTWMRMKLGSEALRTAGWTDGLRFKDKTKSLWCASLSPGKKSSLGFYVQALCFLLRTHLSVSFSFPLFLSFSLSLSLSNTHSHNDTNGTNYKLYKCPSLWPAWPGVTLKGRWVSLWLASVRRGWPLVRLQLIQGWMWEWNGSFSPSFSFPLSFSLFSSLLSSLSLSLSTGHHWTLYTAQIAICPDQAGSRLFLISKRMGFIAIACMEYPARIKNRVDQRVINCTFCLCHGHSLWLSLPSNLLIWVDHAVHFDRSHEVHKEMDTDVTDAIKWPKSSQIVASHGWS